MISPEYKELNRQLHADRKTYGAGGHKESSRIVGLCKRAGLREVLDYGAGKGSLAAALRKAKLQVTEYDPAVPGKDVLPTGSWDVVTCIDVLEHVEPEHLAEVLGSILERTGTRAYFIIATRPAQKTLADGRNAHLIVEPIHWWASALVDAGFRSLDIRESAPDEWRVIAH